MISTIIPVIVSACVLIGAFLVLTVAIAFFKESDAISRMNALSPATGLGLPLIVIGVAIERTAMQGVDAMLIAKTIVTVVALILVSSVASNVLSRAAFRSGAPVSERTKPNDLADPHTL